MKKVSLISKQMFPTKNIEKGLSFYQSFIMTKSEWKESKIDNF